MSLPPQPSATALPDREGIVARYREPLRRYFVRRGITGGAAEDMAHDSLTQLFSLKSTAHIENVEAYLFQIASSVLHMHFRSQKVRRNYAGTVEQIERLSAEPPTPERILEGKEALKRFQSALGELKPRTREIFLLSRMEGLTYTQIGVRLSLSASAVEKHVAHAVAHLTHRLKDYR